MSERFVLETDQGDGIRLLTLNRPDKLNAWHAPMRRQLRDAVEGAATDNGLRVLIIMLGRPHDATTAKATGLATEIAPAGKTVEVALELAAELGRVAPLALGMAKLVLNSCTDVDAETGRRLERLGQSVLKSTDDHKEASQAFLEKRPPVFTAR
jgi:enoyl-CoA hydratase/carnithine racemase